MEGVWLSGWQKVNASLQRVQKRLPWALIKKILTITFFVAVAILLVVKAREIEWQKVFETLKNTEITTLALTVALSLLCYSFYACFDLFGRYILKTNASAFKTWAAAWISYACNLNLGALIGSVAFRYRLYSQIGVKSATVTQILGISVVTNWLGYFLLAGLLFVSGSVDVPQSWSISNVALQVLGGVFIGVIAFYLYLCGFSSQREFQIRGRSFTLPSLKLASLQFLVACTHWTLMATVIYQFFSGQVEFTTVYAVLLISCVAGAVSHIPGGLGVLEAVFIALLAGQMQRYEILAGLFAYRCVFYFVPLLIALPAYLIFEAKCQAPENQNGD